ncbi:hypothetical protein K440DRAFT_658639 [Wilcoxina mikolae CBS 423.85]|nr:hypothetical protein K440DRAFT_658639 [Wilcoxina mikolae CBS 423.85]
MFNTETGEEEDDDGTTTGNVIAVVVASGALVKSVKSWLESRRIFGKHISRLNPTSSSSFIIHTRLRTDIPADSPITSQPPPPELNTLTVPHSLLSAAAVATEHSSPLITFTTNFLTTHPPPPSTSPHHLLSTTPKRTTIYPPLLLLPHNAFTTPAWKSYLTTHPSFLPSLASFLNTTHIVRNAPISATSITRSPSGLEFLFPPPSPVSDETLWVTTIQHGIHQTWAPEYTMFSRGNIREKARVRLFPGVEGREVADLYAGIGYFVFSYLKAGAKRVWCWEINPWSVEGLRRGCGRNGWSVKVVKPGEEEEEEEWEDKGERVVVFEEGNENAVRRMQGKKKKVAHVNLGLLPTSRGAWETAVELVEVGGWVHVHENVGEEEVEVKRRQVVEEFARISGNNKVRCEHVERVKTFAPGVVHCVFDVRVGKGEAVES